jgi:hypothetical protein
MDFLKSSSYDAVLRLGIKALEANVLPDFVLRRATRALLKSRLNSLYKSTGEEQLQALMSFVQCAFSFLLCLSQYFCLLSYNVIGWLVGWLVAARGCLFALERDTKNTRSFMSILALDCIWFSIFLYLNFMLQRCELLTCTFSSFWLEISCFHLGHSLTSRSTRS